MAAPMAGSEVPDEKAQEVPAPVAPEPGAKRERRTLLRLLQCVFTCYFYTGFRGSAVLVALQLTLSLDLAMGRVQWQVMLQTRKLPSLCRTCKSVG